ncbi:MAG: DUF2459 domain-containing protein [Erythrobacter sp.]
MHAGLRWTKRVAAMLFSVVAAFLLSAWIGSSIPRNSDWEEPKSGVTIMLETNGIHTGIIMPLVTPQKDWRSLFPASDLPNPNRPYTHVSVSFGEREVFLSTPRLVDVSASALLGAAIGGDGLLHIAHYVRPAPADDFRELVISEAQYAALVAEIERQVPAPSPTREVNPGYAFHDVFYDTPATYHLGNTCNQWTSDTLAAAGIKTGWWTPMSGGLMKWVDRPN